MSAVSRAELEPAFVLHARPWRESSQIAEVFSHHYGRIGIIARGARRPGSRFRGALTPFLALRLSWSGRGELMTLHEAEVIGTVARYDSRQVMAAFYVNELLLRLLERSDPHPLLFARYSRFLEDLAATSCMESLLRRFELLLLEDLGYGLSLDTDAATGEPVLPNLLYEFRVEQGPVRVSRGMDDQLHFTGQELLAISLGTLTNEQDRAAARRLLRAALNFQLGHRTLNTRKVAAAMKR